MKSHTFRVTCSFNVQYSFTDSEVTADPDDDAISPTEDAIAALRADIEATLGEKYAVSFVNVDADSDDLLGSETVAERWASTQEQTLDYFQGVVTEYLRATRTQFVNTEYMINLDEDGTYKKGRHWYCDAVAIDLSNRTVHLCEITYSKTLQSLSTRLQAWANHWPELLAAIYRDSALPGDWEVSPRVFVPAENRNVLEKCISGIKSPDGCISLMPKPIITTLESVLPWKYRSWNGKAFAAEGEA
jgi:hypothetical protein